MNRAPGVLLAQLRALALDPEPAPAAPLRAPPAILPAALLAFHPVALLVVARLAHWPLWSAPALVAAGCLPGLLRRRWMSEVLAPFIILYGVAALRLLIVNGLHRLPADELNYAWALGLSLAWALLIALRSFDKLWWAAALVAAGAAGLMLNLLWGYAAAGVTGSDPFAYVQMALDLAQHGTALHQFPLAVFAAGLGLPTLPATHVGYVLPNAQGLAPTVWPPALACCWRAPTGWAANG